MAVDAIADMNADAHDHSIVRILPRPGDTGRAKEILTLLESA
jgi:hypothetical protein